MTSTVTAATIAAISSSSFAALSSGSGIIAVALILILLVEQALLHAYAGSRYKERAKRFYVVAVPLLIVFVYIFILRLVQLLHIF